MSDRAFRVGSSASDQLFIDRTHLLRPAVFNTMIENGDAHAKNLVGSIA